MSQTKRFFLLWRLGILSACFWMPAPASAQEACADPFYGRQIILDPNFSDEFRQTAQTELAHWLGRITQQNFTVTNEGESAGVCGIRLLLSDAPSLRSIAPRAVSDKLAELNQSYRQSFIFHSQPGGSLWIVARAEEGARNGLYHYLDRLGARFYFSGDSWSIVPSKSDIRLAVDELRVPDFHTFTFNGGGFGPGRLPVDLTYRKKNRIQTWSARNMFPWEIQCNGHTGEAFNATFKEEIKADPLYHAEVDGERLTCDWVGRVDQGRACSTKPHYTYHGRVSCDEPGAVVTYTDASGVDACEDPMDYTSDAGVEKLYSGWRLDLLERNILQDPDGRSAFGISVEPGDGSNHCNCEKCLNLLRHGPYDLGVDRDATDSDRVFHLSNVVAKKIDEEFPGRYACLYAYNKHAEVPTIPLMHNTMVSLAPYAFQRTGLTPEGLIRAWAKKSRENPWGPFRMGSRDYWCITDWCRDLPTQSNSEVADKMAFWNDNGLETASIETTFAMGAMGLNLYLAGRLVWDSKADVDAIKEEFYRLAFGMAQGPMRRMLERWDSGFGLHEQELGRSWADLADAQLALGQAPDPAVQARVDDYKSYVQYLGFRLALGAATDPAERDRIGREMLHFMWRIYDNDMVNTYRMYDLLRTDSAMSDAALADWAISNPNAALWTQPLNAALNIPLSTDEIRQMLTDNLLRYQPLDIQERTYSNRLIPLVPDATGPELVPSYRFVTDHTFAFYVSPGKDVRFNVISTHGTGAFAPDPLTVEDENGTVIHRASIPMLVTSTTTEIHLPNLATGLYRVRVWDDLNRYSFQVPKNLPFVVEGKIISRFRVPNFKTYFYVPKGVHQVAIYAPSNTTPRIHSPADGYRASVPYANHGPDLIYFDVGDQDGKAWAFSEISYPAAMRFLNVPSVVSFSPDQMMIPRELSDLPRLVPLVPESASEALIPSYRFITDHTFAFYVSREKDIRFNVLTTRGTGTFAPAPLTVEEDNGAVIYQTGLPILTTTTTTEVYLPKLKPGLYRVQVRDRNNRFSFQVPKSLPFVAEGTIYSQFRVPNFKTYFYVPKGVKQVTLNMRSNTPFRIHSPADGYAKAVPYGSPGPDLISFDVGDQDGKVWAFSEISSPLPVRFVNVPSIISFSPDQMLIPRDLALQAR